MKVTIDIDCSPEEARAFMGLPDVAPMQKAVMDKMQEEMLSKMTMLDAETMFKTWMPNNVEGFESMQKFWSQMAGSMSGMGGKSK
ncbi:MAG: hypothetical protein HOC33_16890 [Alphaproteobacteria bacterium]|jgi:hypothetical protein|nr:hypothetical protein [Alphaproteobacteria bacterium]MBT4084984.1 hypothetical protein [Alphaproteobacteria bacterium]MBT4545532.1 hypothetical protein [Alphaproteobacteria bacterium]